MKKQEAIFITKWKDRVRGVIELKYGKQDSDKMNAFLDKIIKKNLINPKVGIVNNYINKISKIDVLTLIDSIEKNQLIIGGGGVLYQQHAMKENPLISFIIDNMALRKEYQKLAREYENGSYEWLSFDIAQLNTKILINTLYGVMGYAGFVLYNRFIAESITNQGRQIVSTSIMAFENFVSDAVQFSTNSELYEYISNIHNEYVDKYKGKLDITPFEINDIDRELVKRLINKCAFEVSDETVLSLETIIGRMGKTEKHLLFYKNNLLKFNDNPIIREKYVYIYDNINVLLDGKVERIEDEKIQNMVNDLWDLYNVFVFYDYQIFDRVRKSMYVDKTSVVYSDTDSVFNGVNKYVEFMKDIGKASNKTTQELETTIVNVLIIFMERMINNTLFTLAKSMNTPDNYAQRLKMENEIYMDRVLFTGMAKKRYIANALTIKGKLMNGGKGESVIKGFDFIKSVTKPFVRDFYTQICLDDILTSPNIDVEKIFKKMIELRLDIEESMRRGESKYFKQANVKMVDHYKQPYSTQGVTASLLWNALNPQYQIELPGDVDIIPIKDLRFQAPTKKQQETSSKGVKRVEENEYKNKNILWLQENHPEQFALLEKNIYNNPNPLIRHMSLSSIAKPKNEDIPLPQWFGEIIDTEKIVVDTLGLFAPILESLGLKNLKTKSNTVYPSNMIDL